MDLRFHTQDSGLSATTRCRLALEAAVAIAADPHAGAAAVRAKKEASGKDAAGVEGVRWFLRVVLRDGRVIWPEEVESYVRRLDMSQAPELRPVRDRVANEFRAAYDAATRALDERQRRIDFADDAADWHTGRSSGVAGHHE